MISKRALINASCFIVAGLYLLAHPAAFAALQGDHPPFRAFEIGLDVFPQNFAIAQDNRAFVYIGNTEGVVIFDGEQWQLVELPNHEIVRSLAHDGNNRIYVGGYDLFGYIELDNTGTPRFYDLTPRFKDNLAGRDFADIWEILITPQGVFFRALRHLFLFNPQSDKTSHWEHEGRFGAIAWYKDAPLLQVRGEGFKRLLDGEWQLMAGTESLSVRIGGVLPLPNGNLLIIDGDYPWQEFGEQGVISRNMPRGFPAPATINAGTTAMDGTLIMATSDGHVYFYDPAGNSYRSIKLADDFLPDVIAGNGAVLAVADGYFFTVSWPSDWTVIDTRNGLKGSSEKIVHHDDVWYVLSSSGALISSGEADSFAKLNWTDNGASDILRLDDGSVLFAESYRLLRVDPTGTQPLSDDSLYPRLLHRSRFDQDIIYIGTEHGLAVLQRRAGVWGLVYQPTMNGTRVNSLAEVSENEVWVGTDRSGAYRLTLTRPGQTDDSWHMAATEFNKTHGIAYGKIQTSWIAASPSSELFVTTMAGIFRWQSDGFVPDDMDGLGTLRGQDDVLRLTWTTDGKAWAYSDKKVFRSTGKEWIENDPGQVLKGVFQSHQFDGSRVIFGTSASMMIFDPGAKTAKYQPPPLSLVRIELEREGGRQRLPLDIPPQLGNRDGWMHVHFTLPDMIQERPVRYQSKLMPVESAFGDWTESNHVSYFDLAPDEYQLQIRAQDSRGNIVERPALQFSVLPAWYQTRWAWAAQGIVMLLLIVAVAQVLYHWRSRTLAAENLRLETMVAARTRELESANRQLDSLAHLDSLTEIPNRRRLEGYLTEIWGLSVERNRELAIAIVDVDHFKKYNDTYGHPEGDKLLKQMAAILSRSLRRAEDLVARYGGEEFLMILPGADRNIAMRVAESVCQNIAESKLGITVSIGVAVSSPVQGGDIKALLSAADQALYAAKGAGRNRVMMA